MKNRVLLFCMMFVVIIVGCWMWKDQKDNRKQKFCSGSCRGTVTNESVDDKLTQETNEYSESSVLLGALHEKINKTQIIKIKLIPVDDAHFAARIDLSSPDHKCWNKSKKLYIKVNSVWFDVYDSEDRKLFRLPNHINVDASGEPGAHDRARGDIKWQWGDDLSIIGVQQIIQSKQRTARNGLEGEFSEYPPDAAKIYLYDVNKLNCVYELIPPEVPKGMIVRIEGIANDGSLSLAALSSDAYNNGDDFKNNSNEYKYLGVYHYTK